MAVMETIQHHFMGSIFSRVKSVYWFYFWQSSWDTKYHFVNDTFTKKTGLSYWLALCDGYHVSKWLMLVSFSIAAVGFDILSLIYCFSSIYVVHYVFYEVLFQGK